MPSFNPSVLHPAALEAIDRMGASLVEEFETGSPPVGPPDPFETRIAEPVVKVLSVAPLSELTDLTTRRLGWMIETGGAPRRLDGAAYRRLREQVERLQRKRPFAGGFSERFLEQTIVAWCRRVILDEAPGPLSTHLLAECERAHAEHRFLVPLSHVEIAHDFAIGDVRVVTIDPALFQPAGALDGAAAALGGIGSGGRPDLAATFANRTAVEITVTGEPEYARIRALVIAHEVAAVLRFCSPATVSARVPSPVQVAGVAPLPAATLLHLRDRRVTGQQAMLTHYGLAQWKLDAAAIAQLTTGTLSNLAFFFDGREHNAFGERLRAAFFAYGRALGRLEVTDRLVDMIGALEALLLASDSENLQTSVGERLAFLTARGADARLAVVADYRRAYQMRSRAVHHLRGVEDEDAADRLFCHVFLAFHKLISGLSIFETPEALFTEIDRMKFSGRPANTGGGGRPPDACDTAPEPRGETA